MCEITERIREVAQRHFIDVSERPSVRVLGARGIFSEAQEIGTYSAFRGRVSEITIPVHVAYQKEKETPFYRELRMAKLSVPVIPFTHPLSMGQGGY